MANTQELFYAVVGSVDATVDTIKGIGIPDRKSTQKVYKDFVKRGKSLTTRIKNSAPTKQAITQTKTARTQVKAAATSVTKAVQAGTSGSSTQLKKQSKTARTQVKAAATSVNKAVRANAKATRSAAGKVATKAS
jgi:hypothetical protein